jgi:tRNA dimethylallyltransferase
MWHCAPVDAFSLRCTLNVTLYPLIAVVGPTGSGKTDLALHLAERFHGEIVNCDSVQIYRHFDIGTAKTPAELRRGIPHHLIDIVEPAEVFTAGDYAQRARAALTEIASRDRLPVVTGGTGFYLRALFEGLFPGPRRDHAMRARLTARERRRPGSLHRVLSRLDAQSAARIHANDINKTIRAVEVCLLARRPLSRMFEQGRDPLQGFEIVKIGLNPSRDALYGRLDRRFERMIDAGLLDEVRRLLESGVDPKSKPFESLGYKQALAVVRGDSPLEAAMASAKQETRRYAKRQMTWFRRERDIKWFLGFGDRPEVQEQVSEFVQQALRLS